MLSKHAVYWKIKAPACSYCVRNHVVLADQGFYLLGVGTLLSMVFSVEARTGIVPSPYFSSCVVFGETSGSRPCSPECQFLCILTWSAHCSSL